MPLSTNIPSLFRTASLLVALISSGSLARSIRAKRETKDTVASKPFFSSFGQGLNPSIPGQRSANLQAGVPPGLSPQLQSLANNLGAGNLNLGGLLGGNGGNLASSLQGSLGNLGSSGGLSNLLSNTGLGGILSGLTQGVGGGGGNSPSSFIPTLPTQNGGGSARFGGAGFPDFGRASPSSTSPLNIANGKINEWRDLGGVGGPIDIQGITSGSLPGLAPIPVPGFPGPSDVPKIPGVNTIPGLDMWNYLVGSLIPQAVPSANQLLGGSITRLLPQASTKNLAKDVFRALHPPAADVEVDRMMGRWFQVINSPHVIREACTVSHFGALTNNTYSATFTMLKFYREGNPNGPPRFSLGYGFKAGADGQFVVHNSNTADSEPFWVVAAGPLNKFNQYDYAIVSNWVRFPVFVIARDPERFQRLHMRSVLQYLEENNYINVLTKAFNMIAPVDYSQCQYTPTFSGAG